MALGLIYLSNQLVNRVFLKHGGEHCQVNAEDLETVSVDIVAERNER